MAHFNAPIELGYLITSICLVGYVFGPLLWGPASELCTFPLSSISPSLFTLPSFPKLPSRPKTNFPADSRLLHALPPRPSTRTQPRHSPRHAILRGPLRRRATLELRWCHVRYMGSLYARLRHGYLPRGSILRPRVGSYRWWLVRPPSLPLNCDLKWLI